MGKVSNETALVLRDVSTEIYHWLRLCDGIVFKKRLKYDKKARKCRKTE